jgi:hypothetical protein
MSKEIESFVRRVFEIHENCELWESVRLASKEYGLTDTEGYNIIIDRMGCG